LKRYARDNWNEIRENLPVARKVVDAVAAAVSVRKEQAA
jgi:hypothetical protein